MFKNQRINIIFITILATFLSCLAYDFYLKHSKTEEEVFLEKMRYLGSEDKSLKASSDFLQIANLYDEYRSNRVAFDKKNNDKLIEFEGSISEITNDHDCAAIKFKITDENDQYIGYAECSNCPATKDKWSEKWPNEIAQLQLGQTVRIKGYYSRNLSNSDNISFYKCRIIK